MDKNSEPSGVDIMLQDALDLLRLLQQADHAGESVPVTIPQQLIRAAGVFITLVVVMYQRHPRELAESMVHLKSSIEDSKNVTTLH